MARVGRVVPTALLCLISAGCPALLSDEWTIAPDDSDASVSEAGADGPNPTNEGGGTDGSVDSAVDVTCSKVCGVGRTCSAGGCLPEWVPTSAPPGSFVGRQQAAACAMGSKVFIWGGANAAGTELSDGAIYDPQADTWTAVTSTGAPTARVGATCAWSGSVVILYGGGDLGATQDLNSGGRYDPATDSWSTTTNGGAPAARRFAFSAWSGNRYIVFGGENKAGAAQRDAFRYDPVGDAWDGKAAGSPNPALDQTTTRVGTDLLVFGGAGDLATLNAFNAAANTWSAPANVGPPAGRTGAFGAAAGNTWVVWGGTSAGTSRANGARYDDTGHTWLGATTDTNAPSARHFRGRQTGWTGSLDATTVLVAGGLGTTDFKKDGAYYDTGANSWTAIAPWPSGADHEWAAGVVTDAGDFVVWGGRSGGVVSAAAGERWHRP